MDIGTRPLCVKCKEKPRAYAYKKGKKIYWRKQCDTCIRKAKNLKIGGVTPLQRSGYVKKKRCELCSFKAIEHIQLDVIFIDGSHFADNVFKDCKNSWPILKKEGILILDDYFWKGYEKPEQNPAFAINKFLKEINEEYKIIKLTKFQLFLRKLS